MLGLVLRHNGRLLLYESDASGNLTLVTQLIRLKSGLYRPSGELRS